MASLPASPPGTPWQGTPFPLRAPRPCEVSSGGPAGSDPPPLPPRRCPAGSTSRSLCASPSAGNGTPAAGAAADPGRDPADQRREPEEEAGEGGGGADGRPAGAAVPAEEAGGCSRSPCRGGAPRSPGARRGCRGPRGPPPRPLTAAFPAQAREAEFEAEQEKIRHEKEMETARLRALQEKAQDHQAEQVLLLLPGPRAGPFVRWPLWRGLTHILYFSCSRSLGLKRKARVEQEVWRRPL